MTKKRLKLIRNLLLTILVFVCLFATAVRLAYGDKILPNVSIGQILVSGLKDIDASERVYEYYDTIIENGFPVLIGTTKDSIRLQGGDYSLDVDDMIQAAYDFGRTEPAHERLYVWLSAPFKKTYIRPVVRINEGTVMAQIDSLASITDKPRKDVRLNIRGTEVDILLDTSSGIIIDRQKALKDVVASLSQFSAGPVAIEIKEDRPFANPESAKIAKDMVVSMMAQGIDLEYEDGLATIGRDRIGKWIINSYDGDRVFPIVDRRVVSQYVAGLAEKINRTPQKPELVFEGEKVANFKPPHPGRALQETQTVDLLVKELEARRTGQKAVTMIHLPIKVTFAGGMIPENVQGISELIGKATTPFTGSPANRIANIKNGVKFLTGIIVNPGQEFSTLGALGTVDNTTGYLPELVIKGDRTEPEFGGGLCQVSTTLFRAVLDAGLPVTARRNHSYRVSYYEKDGLGNYIGPGLDATIYQPDLDFKFKNDTESSILIFGYVNTSKVTFELYGTKDGRKVELIGPKTLTETAPGPAVYIETDTLAAGVKKQIETAHPGGSAVATYTVTYSDGREEKQEFKSWYRKWPARYLVGTGGATPSTSATPQPTSTGSP